MQTKQISLVVVQTMINRVKLKQVMGAKTKANEEDRYNKKKLKKEKSITTTKDTNSCRLRQDDQENLEYYLPKWVSIGPIHPTDDGFKKLKDGDDRELKYSIKQFIRLNVMTPQKHHKSLEPVEIDDQSQESAHLLDLLRLALLQQFNNYTPLGY
ncbi:hypothetical protein L484_005821 [Morus notabilis]|uniref:Uncharacterized protein n=1 Tax=Morus notabilis TaxID=981085 RepID=W9RNB7_9ROSA|nr:hypothetical protein L484_005821 [Morus notabilis]